MKIKISEDERYPVFYIAEDFGVECEVDEKKVKRWKRIKKQFDVIQQEMCEEKEKHENSNS
jgi:hypothetical protein